MNPLTGKPGEGVFILLSVRFSKVVYTPPGGEKGVFRGGGRGYGLCSVIGLKIYLLEAIFLKGVARE